MGLLLFIIVHICEILRQPPVILGCIDGCMVSRVVWSRQKNLSTPKLGRTQKFLLNHVLQLLKSGTVEYHCKAEKKASGEVQAHSYKAVGLKQATYGGEDASPSSAPHCPRD